MIIVLNNPMHNNMFNFEHDHETKNAPSWRSEVLPLSSSDELVAQSLLGQFNDLSTCIAEDRQMVEERHIIFYYYNGSFLISIS